MSSHGSADQKSECYVPMMSKTGVLILGPASHLVELPAPPRRTRLVEFLAQPQPSVRSADTVRKPPTGSLYVFCPYIQVYKYHSLVLLVEMPGTFQYTH